MAPIAPLLSPVLVVQTAIPGREEEQEEKNVKKLASVWIPRLFNTDL